jgi:predicted amidohydrolase YtcJ
MANGLGITSIQEANITPRALKIYHNIASRGALTVRVQCALITDAGTPDSQVDEFIALREKYTVGDMLRASSAKVFEDGGIEGHTAALLEPYTDRPGFSGEVYWDLQRLISIGTRLDKAGFQLHIHVIGDKATRVALDAIAAIRKANGFTDTRPQLAHLQLVAPSDIARFRQLKVVANFSPLWAYADAWIDESTLPVLGPERTGRLYPMQSFFAAGAVVSAGSDWPVSALNPFEAIQVGVTRQPLGRSRRAILDTRGARDAPRTARRLHRQWGVRQPPGESDRLPRNRQGRRLRHPRPQSLLHPGPRDRQDPRPANLPRRQGSLPRRRQGYRSRRDGAAASESMRTLLVAFPAPSASPRMQRA